MKKTFFVASLFYLLINSANAQDAKTPTPQWRPAYHFTPKKNWTNDPNGLIYINGVYHLYHQYNPFENKWGHMSWGHATSKDLIHWDHQPIAMQEMVMPDDTISIFSGCAVWDKNNSSGFCKDGGCLVAVYTGNHSLRREAQYVSYSNDTGRTFTFYDNNPIIDLQKKDFRDPSVFWHKETNRWIMVVALPTAFKVRFYASDDLKNWKALSDFGPDGASKSVWECPFMVRLPVDGKSSKNKWVLMHSTASSKGGPGMQYFIGEFDGATFKNDAPSDSMRLVDYGDSFYAAIPWNDLPGGKETFIGWLVPGPQETYPWKGQMSIPRDLSLKTTSEGIKLYQLPAAVIKNALPSLSNNKVFTRKNMAISNEEISLRKSGELSQNAYWMEAELEPGDAKQIGFKIGQLNNNQERIEETVVAFDTKKNQLTVDRTLSPGGKVNAKKIIQDLSIKTEKGKLTLQVLVDRSSLEIFVNNGEKVLSTLIFPGRSATGLSVFATEGKGMVKNLKIWDLSGISQATADTE